MKYYISIALIISMFAVYFLAFVTHGQEGAEVPIVMYHSVLKNNSRIGKYVVSPAQIESDMKFLKERGYETVTVNDLINYVYKGKKLPEKPVILSFDDGHYNNCVYVAPLLEKYKMKAVVSVIGEYADQFTESGDQNPNYSYVTWDDIKKMQDSGLFEIQNHSYYFHYTGTIRKGSKKNPGESPANYCKKFCEDTQSMNERLAKDGVNAFCYTYPFGFYCKESEEYVRKLGFKASLSCREGMNYITRNKECLYLLKRYNRAAGPSSAKFFAKVLK